MTYVGASVEDTTVVVTGGGTGIGAAIAERFAAEGAHVVVTGRRAAPLDALAKRTAATPIVADATDPEAARRLRDAVDDAFGAVDTLVCNAGGGGFSAAGDTTDEEWRASLAANLDGAFVTTRAFLPDLRQSRGAIVLVSSLSGLFAGPSMSGYTTAKHALIGLTKSLARDYGPDGVRVNAVCPGWVRTPMADAEMDELVAEGLAADRRAGYELVSRDVPLRRVADPAEIAAAVRFLGSDEARYVTGANLVVDGGAHVVDVPTVALQRVRS